MKLFGSIAGCAAVFVALTAQAAFVDHGTYFTDTVSSLDWMDVTTTAGRSYNDVTSQLGAGGEFAGWRYATGDEFKSLTARFSGVPVATYGQVFMEPDRVDGLVTMFGSTADTYYLSVFGVTYNEKFGLAPGFDTFETAGFLADSPGIGADGSPERWLAILFDDDRSPTLSPDYAMAHWASVQSGVASYYYGSFLVRDSAVAQVPEPSVLWLLALGIPGLALARRRKHAPRTAVRAL